MKAPHATLIKNAQLFAPQSLGLKHLIICAERIMYIGDEIPVLDSSLDIAEVDAEGAAVIPGLIDMHTHITGGGGEAGFATKVPPVGLTRFTRAGVTTVVGLLGTDDLTRNTESVVAQVYALREEGLSAYCYTGGYHVPPTTLTGSVKSDIVFVEPVIGVGELAISDHRSSQPTLNELLKIASEAHIARLMTHKAGVLHLHVGDGERGLSLIKDAVEISEIPARTFNPTHVNRRKELFEEACDLVKRGCAIDVTAFETGSVGFEPAEALRRFAAADLPQSKLTISSDGGGCLPNFNKAGEMTHMDFADAHSLTEVLYELIDEGISQKQSLGKTLERHLPFFTSNVADVLQFHRKGRLREGSDADLIVMDDTHKIRHVMAKGAWHHFDGESKIQGTFEE